MSNTIKPQELQKELSKYLQEYVEDIEKDVKDVTDSVSKEAIKELNVISPVGVRGSYAKGWRKQKGKINKGRYIAKIHNKTDYQLTHLLEFEHATKNEKKTKAIPHIRPVEEKFKKIYGEEITTVIRRRKK